MMYYDDEEERAREDRQGLTEAEYARLQYMRSGTDYDIFWGCHESYL